MTTTSSPTPTCSTADTPIIVVDRRRRGFFTIDNLVLDRYGKDLKPTGIAVYNGLSRYANREGECFPSQTTLANLVGMSRMQVSREIKKLQTLKLIKVDHTFGDNRQQGVNRYTLLDVSPEEEPVTHRYTPRNSQLHPPVTNSDTPRHRQLHEQNPINKTQTEQDPKEQQHAPDPQENNPPVSDAPQDVVVALIEQGISEKVAQQLAKKHSKAQIEEKLEYLAFLQEERPESVLKPSGWLRKAIEENYSAPDGFITAEERKQLEAEASEQMHRAAEVEQQRQTFAEQLLERQEARRRELQEQYGTTEEDYNLWEEVLTLFKYGQPDLHYLYARAQILRCTEETVLLGFEYEGLRRKLEHPGIMKALQRQLKFIAKRPLEVETVLLPVATMGYTEEDRAAR